MLLTTALSSETLFPWRHVRADGLEFRVSGFVVVYGLWLREGTCRGRNSGFHSFFFGSLYLYDRTPQN